MRISKQSAQQIALKLTENKKKIVEKKDGSDFLFTLHFPSAKMMEYDKFAKGKPVRNLMNKIQQHVNSFYSDFINGEDPD